MLALPCLIVGGHELRCVCVCVCVWGGVGGWVRACVVILQCLQILHSSITNIWPPLFTFTNYTFQKERLFSATCLHDELFHLVLLELFSYWDTKNSEAKPKSDFLWVLQFCKQICSYINKARKNWSLVTNKANIMNGLTILSSLWLLLNLPGFQSLESHLVLQISSALPLMTS